LANGVNPADVTKVLLSHIHKDHSGGISRLEGQQRVLSFPGASHYVNRHELAFGLEKGEPSFRVVDFELLAGSDKTVFVEGNGTIDGYIRYETTGAHSPFHMVFWIEEEGERAFFGGDVAPQLQQMKNRFIAKYDYDGKRCMELRQRWWQEGKEQGWTFLFYHDIKTPVFKHD
jgi:glyoxylase-like metal-dependent hydrolase (beta-lactamase superfamily II)